MNRLVARFTNNKCISTDMLGQDWEPALAELLRIQREHAPEREIEQIEMALYDPEYRDRWRFSYLPVDPKTWKPKERPDGPQEESKGAAQTREENRSPAEVQATPGVEASEAVPGGPRGKRGRGVSPKHPKRRSKKSQEHREGHQASPPAKKPKKGQR